MKGNEYPFQQSVRGTLLPFDEITSPEQEKRRQRNFQALISYLPTILAKSKDYKHQQQSKLAYLQKINDPSYEKATLKQTIMDVIDYSLSRKIKVLSPQKPLILLWNMLMLGAIIFNFIQIPLSLCFTAQVYKHQKENPYLFGLNIFFIVTLFFDTFIIRFNLAFYRHGKLIMARSQIILQYLASFFFLDLIAWLVYLFYIALNDHDLIYMKLFFYLKFPQLIRINYQIVEKLIKHTVRYCIYCIFRMIIFLWFITTWVSSIYFAIDFHYYNQKGYYFQTGQLWLTNSNAVNNTNIIESFPKWYYWYQFAVYWSFQTSATVGYGDITPRNPHQVLYCNFVILINTVFFAFYINTIWEIISELQQNTERYTKNWENLRKYIGNKDINEKLKIKIGSYLQQKWIHQSQDLIQQQKNQFLQDLSQQLKVELYVGMKGKLLKSCFGQYYHMHGLQNEWQQLVKLLVFGIEQETIGSGNQIYKFGGQSDKLYYLVKGKLSLAVNQLEIGEFFSLPRLFGQMQFITQNRRQQTAVAESLCFLEILSFATFVENIKANQKLYNKFCELKENVLFSRFNSLWDLHCLKCGSSNHSYKFCPEINKWRKRILNPLYGFKQLRSEKAQRKHVPRMELKSQKLKDRKLERQVESKDEVKCLLAYRQAFNFN